MNKARLKPGDIVKIFAQDPFRKAYYQQKDVVDLHDKIGVILEQKPYEEIYRVELQGYPGLIVEFLHYELTKVKG